MQTFLGFSSVLEIVQGTEYLTVNVVLFFCLFFKSKKRFGVKKKKNIYIYIYIYIYIHMIQLAEYFVLEKT